MLPYAYHEAGHAVVGHAIGRLIAQHGLPHVDTLTYWTVGRPWTDQQWGAHLVLYEVAQHAGLRTALLAGILCVVAALVGAAVAARKLGTSMRSAAFGLLLPLVGASWLTQVRTQSLALVPFVIVYGKDGRAVATISGLDLAALDRAIAAGGAR